MKNKKIITITVFITILSIISIFLIIKIFSYQSLKNDCLKRSIKPDGYSISLYFKENTSQLDINNFVNKIKNITEISDIQIKTKDKILKEFKKTHKDEPETNRMLKEIGKNPFLSSIIIKSSIDNIEDFLKFEQNILNSLNTYGLELDSYDDQNLKFFQKEFAKVNKASLVKDLLDYLFSKEGKYFFERKYSKICNPNFSNK